MNHKSSVVFFLAVSLLRLRLVQLIQNHVNEQKALKYKNITVHNLTQSSPNKQFNKILHEMGMSAHQLWLNIAIIVIHHSSQVFIFPMSSLPLYVSCEGVMSFTPFFVIWLSLSCYMLCCMWFMFWITRKIEMIVKK